MPLEAIGGAITSDKLNKNFSFLDSKIGELYTRKKIQGAIRLENGTWSVISDTTHAPLNIGSIVPDAFGVKVNFGFTAKNVRSLIAVPDETYTKQGVTVGASVAKDSVYLQFNRQPLGAYIYYDAASTSWKLEGQTEGISVAFSAGVLTVTHPYVGGKIGNVTERRPNVNARFGTMTATTTQIAIYDATGAVLSNPIGDMMFYFSRGSTGYVDPASLGITNSNIWLLGEMEV